MKKSDWLVRWNKIGTFWYRNDKRRERFVTMCNDPDVQSLTWQAYMDKQLVRARPMAHARIFMKDMRHLLGSAA